MEIIHWLFFLCSLKVTINLSFLLSEIFRGENIFMPNIFCRNNMIRLFALSVVSSMLFCGCKSTSEKDEMAADLEAYGVFLDTMEEADKTDISAYAMSVTAAVEEFDCSTEECIALKEDYQSMASALTTLATGMELNDDEGSDLDDDDTLLLEFQTTLSVIEEQASEHEETLMKKAKKLGLEDEYNDAVN